MPGWAAIPAAADDVLHWSRRASVVSYEHLDSVLNSRCVYDIETMPAKRLNILHQLMETFDPMYALFTEHGATRRRGLIPAGTFDTREVDWPAFAC